MKKLFAVILILLSLVQISNKVEAQGTSIIPGPQIAPIVFTVASQSAMLALSTAKAGDFAIRTDLNKTYILKATPASELSNWAVIAFYDTAQLPVDVRSYANLADALTAIGSTQTTLVIPSAITLTASATIPSTLKLIIDKGGSITKASTYTLTINGPFEAGPYTVFSGFDAGDVTFAQNSVREYLPEWWGATGNGSTDDYTPISKALAAGTGRRVQLTSNSYAVGTIVNVPANTHLVGRGKYSTIVKFLASGLSVKAAAGAVVSDLTVDGDNQADTTCLFAENVDNVTFTNAVVKNCVFHGVALTNGATRAKVDNITAYHIGSRGVIVSTSTYNTVSNLHCYDCYNACVNVDHNSHHNIFSNVYADYSYYSGLWVHNEAYANVFNNFVIRNTQSAVAYNPGVICGWNCYDNVFSNFYIESYYTGFLVRGAVVDGGYTPGHTRNNILSNMRIKGPGGGVVNSYGVQIDSYDSGATKAQYNNFYNLTISNFYYGVGDPYGNGAFYNTFDNIDTRTDINTTYSLAYMDSISKITNWYGLTPTGYMVSAPAFPLTGVEVTNTYPFSVQIFVNGMSGTVNAAIDGAWVGTTAPNTGNGVYIIRSRQTIKFSYSGGTPAWIWFGM